MSLPAQGQCPQELIVLPTLYFQGNNSKSGFVTAAGGLILGSTRPTQLCPSKAGAAAPGARLHGEKSSSTMPSICWEGTHQPQ